jgi:predicted RNA-binding Zn-ribbon protein involved in translation (DUF1610 family)
MRLATVEYCSSCGATVVGAAPGDECRNCGSVVLDA